MPAERCLEESAPAKTSPSRQQVTAGAGGAVRAIPSVPQLSALNTTDPLGNQPTKDTAKIEVKPEHVKLEAPPEGTEESDKCEVLEESPCGRWQKRKKKVSQKHVHGIDDVYLAIDSEEGVEVLWNEIMLQTSLHDNPTVVRELNDVFDHLQTLTHPNIVKFYKYWNKISPTTEKPEKIVFITEYMYSGSLKQFLKKAKTGNSSVSYRTWRRWCTQILAAINYLHQSNLSHANISIETIFVQHNGLIKIGRVVPQQNSAGVKQILDNRNESDFIRHYPPEVYKEDGLMEATGDIYAFGVCALDMIDMKLNGDGRSGEEWRKMSNTEKCAASQKYNLKRLEAVENSQQRDLIEKCLAPNPLARPTAKDCLLHPALFEFPSLRLFAAYAYTNQKLASDMSEAKTRTFKSDTILAEIITRDPATGQQTIRKTIKFSEAQTHDLERYLDDVRNGVYPLICLLSTPETDSKDIAPSETESIEVGPVEEMSYPEEVRRVKQCEVKQKPHAAEADGGEITINIHLKMDDRMNRDLWGTVRCNETARGISEELVRLGFINQLDMEEVASNIDPIILKQPIKSLPIKTAVN